MTNTSKARIDLEQSLRDWAYGKLVLSFGVPAREAWPITTSNIFIPATLVYTEPAKQEAVLRDLLREARYLMQA